MRKLILKISMSIDAFVGGPDGELDWIFSDRDLDARGWSVETVSNASLHIMGSRTFRDMAAFWPTSTDVFAPPMNQIPKAVFSTRGRAILDARDTTAGLESAMRARAQSGLPEQLQPGAESWAQAYVASGNLAEEIAGLKAQPGKPIVAHGGAAFARSLVAQALIDEYHLLVHPVVLGKGLPLFTGIDAPRRLELMRSMAFPKGAVAQIYRPR
jgi:dihydrofolate reductase